MLRCLGIVLLAASSMAAAQTQTTDCTRDYFGNVHCNSTTQPQSQSGVDWLGWSQLYQRQQEQQQQQTNQSMQNLGAAIAVANERNRAKKLEKQVQAAIASDTATAQPPPTDEQPVLLACTMQPSGSVSIALYEKHSRADVTSGGETKTRLATFTNEAVTWNSAVFRVSLSRLDGTLTGAGNIPALEGFTQTGTCQVAQRKF